MVAFSALGTFLLAANLTSFDPTTVRPSDDDSIMNSSKIIFAVRADLAGGRFASAKPVSNVTFPVADIASTVYISQDSYARAIDAVKPANATRNFVSWLIYAGSGTPRVCAQSIYGTTILNTSTEYQFADKTSMTESLLAKVAMPTSTSTDRFGSRSLSQIVFRVESGCMEFATFACNLDDASGAVSFRIGVTRAEYVSLHPSSGMKLCGGQYSVRPIRIDPNYNIAFTVPAGNWATQTVADDAKSFFRYSAPAVTTPPATTTATTTTTVPPTTTTSGSTTTAPPAATSASFLLPFTSSVVAGLGAVFLVL
ncbi:hypothetical protein SPRG_15703 [Saprolegnia parasitica CBS 223.65]|uniref:Uncharacterized protein n=1 Tax=Saprolegnia parasitica (strain CBS 223.65) TaxID=695850 RepID=A0A067BQ24_SAPPC|nr:hypothetical protein SPRG_15703 [Saprolegnia parasitica CBS 223.65]KDO18875.1 hypothetical protein SPRG_15703 [Saprolegnia parasitica CBS 223.65]|eukprot:XP_012210429.1 hypothetical protein SPRG_15703 [Saprolegnia parasitica CBS 223.65]